jgi:hypothetical protein
VPFVVDIKGCDLRSHRGRDPQWDPVAAPLRSSRLRNSARTKNSRGRRSPVRACCRARSFETLARSHPWRRSHSQCGRTLRSLWFVPSVLASASGQSAWPVAPSHPPVDGRLWRVRRRSVVEMATSSPTGGRAAELSGRRSERELPDELIESVRASEGECRRWSSRIGCCVYRRPDASQAESHAKATAGVSPGSLRAAQSRKAGASRIATRGHWPSCSIRQPDRRRRRCTERSRCPRTTRGPQSGPPRSWGQVSPHRAATRTLPGRPCEARRTGWCSSSHDWPPALSRDGCES